MNRMLFPIMAVLLIASTTLAEFKKEYRMTVTVGPTTYWGRGATRFAELVRERTGGRIVVKPYFGSQLLKGAQLNASQMVAMGAIDAAFDSTINMTPVIKELNVFALPFFVNTFDNLDRLETGKTGQILFRAMQKKGIQPLAWGENGFRQLTNRKHPVRMPRDLDGLKIRVVGSPIFIDIYRALGADPVNMNWGDAVTAFQQGTVDGQENPTGILLPVQIYQYHDYVTFWNYLADPLVFYWSKRQWDRFPEDIRTAIRSAAVDAGRYQKALVRAGLDDGRARQLLEEFGTSESIPDPVSELKAGGMTIITLTPDEQAAFRIATAGVVDAWIPRIGESIVNAARQDMGLAP